MSLHYIFQDGNDPPLFCISRILHCNFFPAMDTSAAFSVRLSVDTAINVSPFIFGTRDLNIGDGYDQFSGSLENYWCPNIPIILTWEFYINLTGIFKTPIIGLHRWLNLLWYCRWYWLSTNYSNSKFMNKLSTLFMCWLFILRVRRGRKFNQGQKFLLVYVKSWAWGTERSSVVEWYMFKGHGRHFLGV